MSKSIHKRLIKESRAKISKFLDSFSQNIINEEASVFIGTGVSINSGLPSWQKLLKPCLEELNLANSSKINLYKIAQYYANTHTDAALRKIVNEQINDFFESNIVLEMLLKINFKSIWTTNYDSLIESELKKNKIQHNIITDEKDLTQISTHDKVNIYKINGDVTNPNKMVLTQNDYENYETTHSLFLTFLKKELVSNTFLFIGYSFEDQIIMNCLSSTMRLLDGAGNLHYAFVFIDDNVKNEIEYKVEDLRKRYNIECIYVDSDTMCEVLSLLNHRVKEKKIFISGAYYDVDSSVDLYADKLSKSLVTHLLDNGNRISTGIGRRLGTYITGYANQYLAETSRGNPQKYLSMRPFPFHIELSDEQKESYRTYMQHDCSCAIFMFGQSEHTAISGGYPVHKHYSYGVYQEFLIAKKLGLYIIPIGSTGYESEVIWNEVKSQINKYYYLSKKIDLLKNEKDPDKLSKTIISIINQKNK